MVEKQLNFLNYSDETVKGYEEPIFKKTSCILCTKISRPFDSMRLMKIESM